MGIVVRIVSALVLVVLAPISPVAAEVDCSLASEFVDLAGSLGTLTTGDCTGMPYFLDADEPVIFNDQTATVLRAGTMVQHTTRGVFNWAPENGLSFAFFNAWGGAYSWPGWLLRHKLGSGSGGARASTAAARHTRVLCATYVYPSARTAAIKADGRVEESLSVHPD